MLRILKSIIHGCLVFIGGCTASQPPSPPAPSSPFIRESIQRLFSEHDVVASWEGSALSFPDLSHTLEPVIVSETYPASSTVAIQLDIRLTLGSGEYVLESFGGFGTTRAEAERDAIQNFAANSFHVLLAAFFNHSQTDQVTVESWIIGDTEYDVVLGNIGMRGQFPLSGEGTPDWFIAAEQDLKRQPMEQGIHWIRLYYAQFDNQPSAVEALLDNDTWQPLQSTLSAYEWPKSQDFYSVRIFLVLKPRS